MKIILDMFVMLKVIHSLSPTPDNILVSVCGEVTGTSRPQKILTAATPLSGKKNSGTVTIIYG